MRERLLGWGLWGPAGEEGQQYQEKPAPGSQRLLTPGALFLVENNTQGTVAPGSSKATRKLFES